VYFGWLLFEVVLNRILRSGKSDDKSLDRNSETYIWIIITVSVTIAVFVANNMSHLSSFFIFKEEKMILFGLFLIPVGMIFRFLAIRQLGKFFTVDVTIKKNHEMVQTGFYRYLRHPSYAASLLSFIGMGLSLNNWLSFTIVIVPVFLVFIYRINVEENALLKQFNEEYLIYKNKTKRLIPFIY
jgi:protein-S-isoprenylcysteine O-methyltransferase Ste14